VHSGRVSSAPTFDSRRRDIKVVRYEHTLLSFLSDDLGNLFQGEVRVTQQLFQSFSFFSWKGEQKPVDLIPGCNRLGVLYSGYKAHWFSLWSVSSLSISLPHF